MNEHPPVSRKVAFKASLYDPPWSLLPVSSRHFGCPVAAGAIAGSGVSGLDL